MATYINYGEGEDDATVQSAEWVQRILEFQRGPEAQQEFTEKFTALQQQMESTRRYDYSPMFDLFVAQGQHLFDAIPEQHGEGRVKEVESFFAMIFSMLLLLDDTKHLDDATTTLCKLFSSSPVQQPDLRLRLLMMLYNTFNNPTFEFRYRVFKHTLDYAAAAKIFDQVLPYLEHIDAWMVDWEPYLTVEDKRALYNDLSGYLGALDKRVESFQMLKRYHVLFQGEKAEVLGRKEVHSATVKLIEGAISLPTVMQFDDILNFDTVKALNKTKQDAPLVGLCSVFYSGSVNDLRDFHKANQALFEQHGFSLEDAMSKIRLLTLATLTHGQSEVGLAAIAAALEEEEEAVERWVVRAISEGVVDGRIDQLNRKVLVKSSFQRKFEKEEWAFLDSRLTQWVENLEDVIKFIGDHKKGAAAA